jgi:hypothetical protein
MHKIDLPVLRNNATARFTYMVGSYTVGIITPSRQKHIVPIGAVRAAWKGAPIAADTRNGMHDRRITPEEIANYILISRLK